MTSQELAKFDESRAKEVAIIAEMEQDWITLKGGVKIRRNSRRKSLEFSGINEGTWLGKYTCDFHFFVIEDYCTVIPKATFIQVRGYNLDRDVEVKIQHHILHVRSVPIVAEQRHESKEISSFDDLEREFKMDSGNPRKNSASRLTSSEIRSASSEINLISEPGSRESSELRRSG